MDNCSIGVDENTKWEEGFMSKRSKETSALLIVLGIIGGFVAANLAGTAISYHKNKKKMEQHENQHNQMHSVTMGKINVEVGEKTKNLFLTCLSGKAVVNMNRIPENKEVNVELLSVFGNVVINVPFGVKVVCEGEGYFEQLRNVAGELEEDGVATIYIHRKSLFSNLTIRPVRRWSK